MKYTVLTTFNANGYAKYGRRMITTFLNHWPKSVNLIVYSEDCTVTESAENLEIRDIATVSDLTAFKQRWQAVPYATGDISHDPVRSLRKDAGKGFKWDAVRFAHKVYAVFHCAKTATSTWLLWMDADTICHSTITTEDIDTLCTAHTDLCFLGRGGKFSECGLYAMNLTSPATKLFLTKFQQAYDTAENGIFKLDEWHDSFVFDAVRRGANLVELDWSSHLITGEGHPLINSAWGAWLDHLKGARKNLGRSKQVDLKVKRTEAYWQ
jgi:hypothetical protein